jgi:hypothetical protein
MNTGCSKRLFSKAAARSATPRVMSVTFADAGEAVSRQCPGLRRHDLARLSRACWERPLAQRGYVEGPSDARRG